MKSFPNSATSCGVSCELLLVRVIRPLEIWLADASKDETVGLRALQALTRHAIFLTVVIILTVFLSPDLFGLVPNSLDPLFYTGYAINLDDALKAAGNDHYFVTRWSSYMPQYLACQVFGPYWGRLVLRLVMVGIIFEIFWQLGKRFNATPVKKILGATFVVTTPLFIRGFTTDYVEHSAIFYGIVLIAIIVMRGFTWKPSLLFGVFGALIIVSNPNNFAIVGICLVAWIFTPRDRLNILSLIKACVSGLVGALLVAMFGYLIFAYHYGIGNVYEPTIQFIRSYVAPEQDLWTSPGRDWILHFSWIYIPVILLVMSRVVLANLPEGQQVITKKVQRVSVTLYAYHIFTQIRAGHAIETGYYWALLLAPFFVLFFVLLLKILEQRNLRKGTFITLIVYLILIKFEVPQELQLPDGLLLLALIAVFVSILLFFNWHRPSRVLLFPGLIVGLLWMQIGAPSYSVLTYGGDLNSPRYEDVYGESSAQSNDILKETIWFTQQMDRLEEDWKTTFLTAGGWSAAIVGTYIPHPFSRWLVANSAEYPLSFNVQGELEFGHRKYLAVYGDAREVNSLLLSVRRQLPNSDIVLDETHDKNLRYRLVVMRGDSRSLAKMTIFPAQLSRNIGTDEKDGSVLLEPQNGPGFGTFGPYFSLGQGSYVAELFFETDEIGNIGTFEVFSDSRFSTYNTQIESDGPGISSAKVPFTVLPDDATWQLRTEYEASTRVRLLRIELRREVKNE
jgi:hypothetical protein